jgi:hypothetical protein
VFDRFVLKHSSGKLLKSLIDSKCSYIFVVTLKANIWPIYDPENDEEVGRIISARKATSHERRAYEEDNF